MNQTIRTKIIKVGNSRGIRLPRAILEQAGLKDEVELKVEGNRLIILPASRPRQGWEALFAAMTERGDDQLLDEPAATDWDREEWTW